MEIINELLPDNVRDIGTFGNFAQKNARYKAAVCRYLRLRFLGVDGAGDCFFLSVCVALQATLPAVPANLADKDLLRAACIQFLRTCEHSQRPLSERVVVEMEAELNVDLEASNRQTLRDTRIHGFHPNTIQDYLDASAFSGVWVAGYHWLRAVSTIAGVRIGVIIYGHDSIVYFGHGTHTIFLYKVQVNRGIMIILHLICPLPSSSMQKLTLMRWCHNQVMYITRTTYPFFTLPAAEVVAPLQPQMKWVDPAEAKRMAAAQQQQAILELVQQDKEERRQRKLQAAAAPATAVPSSLQRE
jgi:hypothetical protein